MRDFTEPRIKQLAREGNWAMVEVLYGAIGNRFLELYPGQVEQPLRITMHVLPRVPRRDRPNLQTPFVQMLKRIARVFSTTSIQLMGTTPGRFVQSNPDGSVSPLRDPSLLIGAIAEMPRDFKTSRFKPRAQPPEPDPQAVWNRRTDPYPPEFEPRHRAN